jgi:hypothetical protein
MMEDSGVFHADEERKGFLNDVCTLSEAIGHFAPAARLVVANFLCFAAIATAVDDKRLGMDGGHFEDVGAEDLGDDRFGVTARSWVTVMLVMIVVEE